MDKIVAEGDGIAVWRERRMAAFLEVSESLREYSGQLMAEVPKHIRWAAGDTCKCGVPCWCAKAHPALLMALVDALEWPDRDLPRRHCLEGADVIGEAFDSGLWPLKSDERLASDAKFHPRISEEELFAGSVASRADVAARHRL